MAESFGNQTVLANGEILIFLKQFSDGTHFYSKNHYLSSDVMKWFVPLTLGARTVSRKVFELLENILSSRDVKHLKLGGARHFEGTFS